MSTTAFVRRFIFYTAGDRIFSTRELLHCGSRGAVDQTIYRLIKSGDIIRVARGLFIKFGVSFPSISQIAIAKAAAFGKTISQHTTVAASLLDPGHSNSKSISNHYSFACSGASSSFRTDNAKIIFRSSSPRKLSLSPELPGTILRALWHIGRIACNKEIANQVKVTLNRDQRDIIRNSVALIPAWMHPYFSFLRR